MPERSNFGASAEVHLRNFSETSRAFSKAGKDAARMFRKVFREVAEPIQKDAQELAQQEISHIGKRWWRMRVGVTRKVVYVAPQQRGRMTKTDPKRYSRPNIKTLLADKALDPALEKNEPFIEARTLNALDVLADNWEKF